jgi:hypothetical protein
MPPGMEEVERIFDMLKNFFLCNAGGIWIKIHLNPMIRISALLFRILQV